MSESSHLLDKKGRGRPSNKNSDPIFVDGQGKPIVDNRSTAPHDARYELIPHCCTVCFGRLLRRYLGGGRRKKYEYRCACCGDTHIRFAGEGAFCWCEKTAGLYGKIFECVINTNRRTELPNEFLVQERKIELKPLEIKPDRRVFLSQTDWK